MSTLDGTKEPLTFSEALVALASRVSWPSEEVAREVDEVFRREHNLWNEPDLPVDSEAALREKEINELRARNAELERDARARTLDAELEALRAKNAELEAGNSDGDGKPPAKAAKAAAK